MKVYIICPVRNVTEQQQAAIDSHAADLTASGHEVHNPKYAVDQNDETGLGICRAHFEAMAEADEVHIFWDMASSGSHFDLGMAFALQKPLRLVSEFSEDKPGKSYAKVIREVERGAWA